MKISRRRGVVSIRSQERDYVVPDFSFDQLFQQREPADWLRSRLAKLEPRSEPEGALLPPLENQEVWAAGVTYRRSREARMEESEKEADVYDRVYRAERPELFFKATARRVIGDRGE